MKWFLKALRQYADFKGRARRKEYWMYTLFVIIFAIVVTILDFVLGLRLTITELDELNIPVELGLLNTLLGLALFIPSWAVLVRRLHDVGKSGWWCLIVFIPSIINAIIMLTLYFEVFDLEILTAIKWLLFASSVVLVGLIVCCTILIVWCCTDGQPGENKWGVNPKEEIEMS